MKSKIDIVKTQTNSVKIEICLVVGWNNPFYFRENSASLSSTLAIQHMSRTSAGLQMDLISSLSVVLILQ